MSWAVRAERFGNAVLSPPAVPGSGDDCRTLSLLSRRLCASFIPALLVSRLQWSGRETGPRAQHLADQPDETGRTSGFLLVREPTELSFTYAVIALTSPRGSLCSSHSETPASQSSPSSGRDPRRVAQIVTSATRFSEKTPSPKSERRVSGFMQREGHHQLPHRSRSRRCRRISPRRRNDTPSRCDWHPDCKAVQS